MAKKIIAQKAGGEELAAVLPKDGIPWWKKWHLVRLNISLMLVFMLSSTNGYDGNIMNAFQTLKSWKAFMHHPQGAWLGFINAIYWIAVLVMSPCVALISNRIGRKKTLYTGYVYLVAATAVQASASNSASFIVARVLLGLTCATFGNVAPLIMAESAYPTHRGVITTLYNTGFHVGGIVASWTVFGTRNHSGNWAWRIPSILQIACPLVALPGVLMCSESPRWLVSVGRGEEARAILARNHAGGDLDSPLVNYEYNDIVTTLAAETDATHSSYRRMLQGRGNLHRFYITCTLGFLSQAMGTSVISYYLTLVLDNVGMTSTTDQTVMAGCIQILSAICGFTGANLVDRCGRRRLLFISWVIMMCSLISFTICSGIYNVQHNRKAGLASLPFIFTFMGGYNLAVRGLGLAWLGLVSSTIFNLFISPIAMKSVGWRYYFYPLSLLLFFGPNVYFTYPETTGHTLEQIKQVFDGPTPSDIEGAIVTDGVEKVAEDSSNAAEASLEKLHLEPSK